ncbi:hypothetical protein WJX77_010274 [Trebouxia sp. C0004]
MLGCALKLRKTGACRELKRRDAELTWRGECAHWKQDNTVCSVFEWARIGTMAMGCIGTSSEWWCLHSSMSLQHAVCIGCTSQAGLATCL